MKEKNMLQRVVSLGSAFTNGLLLAAISYTLFLLAASLFRKAPMITPTLIYQVSLPATCLALIGLAALYAAGKSAITNIRASFCDDERAPRTTVFTNTMVSLITASVVSFCSGIVGLSALVVCGSTVLAIISLMLALTSLDQQQSITA